MTCTTIRRKLPGYLDGALRADEHALLRAHVEACPDCCRELERYTKLSMLISRVGPSSPPADLAVRIRVAVGQARAYRSWASRAWSRAALLFSNILEPLAVPATAGVVTALFVFAVVVQSLLVGVPLGAVADDLPTNLAQPARLESLAPFPVPTGTDGNGHAVPSPLLIEATVNAQGEVVRYEILAGTDNLTIRRQLDQVLLFSRFRPRMNFGRPTPGGRVVLSFSEVRVRG